MPYNSYGERRRFTASTTPIIDRVIDKQTLITNREEPSKTGDKFTDNASKAINRHMEGKNTSSDIKAARQRLDAAFSKPGNETNN